jgi:ELWxxDGT repeat protein
MLFYTAGDGSYWKTDGTEAGTVPAAPVGLAAATMNSQMSMPAVAGDALYFPAIDADGPGLFRSDATPSGTRRVFGPVAGPMGWAPKQILRAIGNHVYFVGQAVDELWRTDGTAPGTFSLDVELANILVPPTLAGMDGQVYFAGLPEASTRVWLGRTDGTLAGTGWIKDLASQANGDARLYGVAGGLLHFSVSRPETGWEPWVSDGTAEGTELALDIFPGEESSHPGPVFAFGEAGFFAADGGPDGMELWRRSGSPPAVARFANLAPDGAGPNASHPRDFTLLGEKFLFTARSGSLGRRILWTSDGTPQGTVPVECAADDPADLVVMGGVVLFAAEDGRYGRELWRTDGTAAGTALVADMRPGAGGQGSSNPRHLVTAGSRVFFVADDGAHGSELWVTDGTSAGTRMLRDIFPGLAGSDPALIVPVGQRIACTALDATHGREIWISDGTPEGTVMAEDLHPGPFDAGVVKLVPALGGVFYFAPSSPAAEHPGLRFLPVGT